MLTRPFTRLVVAFGVRKITQRRLVEEVVIGILLLIPLGFVVGLFTSRICTKFTWQRKFIRSRQGRKDPSAVDQVRQIFGR